MRYFRLKDFDCTETGENEMDPMFLMRLDVLRHMCGFPFIVISGFRSVTHSDEVVKDAPGEHTRGTATDILVRGGVQRRLIVKFALAMGFTGVGIKKNMVHIDDRKTEPVLWVY